MLERDDLQMYIKNHPSHEGWMKKMF